MNLTNTQLHSRDGSVALGLDHDAVSLEQIAGEVVESLRDALRWLNSIEHGGRGDVLLNQMPNNCRSRRTMADALAAWDQEHTA